MRTLWGNLTPRHSIYVPMGRIADLIEAIGAETALLCIRKPGRNLGDDDRITVFASEGAFQQAVKMGSRPLIRRS